MERKKLYVLGAAAVLVGGLLTAPLSGAAAKPGPTGTTKSNGVSILSQHTGTAVSVAPGANGLASVTCPSGKIISGGGGATSAFDIFFTDSFPSGNGWTVRGSNRGTTTQSIRAVAVCLG